MWGVDERGQLLGTKNQGEGSSGKSFGQSSLCSAFPLGTSHAWWWLLNSLGASFTKDQVKIWRIQGKKTKGSEAS